jgi:hypothetical protein
MGDSDFTNGRKLYIYILFIIYDDIFLDAAGSFKIETILELLVVIFPLLTVGEFDFERNRNIFRLAPNGV